MALKTLQKKYNELLKVFDEVGVTLNESQKDSLDTFMLDFQSKLNETRDNAIKATKKLVEEKLEKEFKEVFESVMKHKDELFRKTSKIDMVKSHKLITEAVDQYLNDYVKEILPKKNIVDYGRMQKLEQIHESLKGMLLVNDDAVESKVEEVKKQLQDKMVEESNQLKAKLDENEKVLNESIKKNEQLKNKYDALAKKVLIHDKTKNLPIVESKRVKEKLSKMSAVDIEKNFKNVLESVQEEIQEEAAQMNEEQNLEEAINSIMNETSEKTGNKSEETEKVQKSSEGTEVKDDVEENDSEMSEEYEDNDESEDSPVQITESRMRSWIEYLERITPKH